MLVGGIRGGARFCVGVEVFVRWDVEVRYWVIDALCLAMSGIIPPVVHPRRIGTSIAPLRKPKNMLFTVSEVLS